MSTLHQLHELGQSCWLDDLTREMLDSGELGRRVRDEGIRGVTSNPKTFAASLTGGSDYHDDIRRLAGEGENAETIHRRLMVADVTRACDVLRTVYDQSGGADGFVSIEVDPHLARDAGPSLEAARELWREVDRPNCMIKIPGTREGLPAIEQALTEGININITLLFSPDRYDQVLSAYHRAQKDRAARNQPLAPVSSVASFFLSRIDVLVDERLADRDAGDVAGLRGQVALALARRVYSRFLDSLADPEWQRLADQGARPQRPLWASTGRKNPAYSETMYVDSLVARDTVNTMPQKTIEAFQKSGTAREDAIFDKTSDPNTVLAELKAFEIDIEDVASRLEQEGIKKFTDPHDEALDAIRGITGKDLRRQKAKAD